MSEAAYVTYEGLRLPPPEVMRHGGKTDADLVRSAKAIVGRVIAECGLSPEHRVLDIGCGAGRFLIGLQATFGEVRRYLGVDVRRPVIEWAQRYLGDPSGRVAFEWLDIANDRYNPGGALAGSDRIVPVEDHSFDVLTLFSVFSHMQLDDIARYLVELKRVMAPGGRAYVTAFIEEGVPAWEENPEGYLREWSGPLHCVRMDRSTFEGLVADAGLSVERFLHRNEHGKQSAYVLS